VFAALPISQGGGGVKLISIDESYANQLDQLGDLCYGPEFHESAEMVRQKLALFPQGCFACVEKTVFYGYILSLPWLSGEVVPLNAAIRLPPQPDCLYIHDLAVRAEARGRQIGRRLVEKVLHKGKELGFHACTLVAVQGSEPFWGKLGFEILNRQSYGGRLDAARMVRRL
jgi:predicted N-acetyltransferase YhbS